MHDDGCILLAQPSKERWNSHNGQILQRFEFLFHDAGDPATKMNAGS